MIPKVIHCCWFGGRKTALAERCQASWRKFAPDYEIRECNELPLDAPDFVRRALAEKKWAFASDWMRFRLLADAGGVYFDFDEELTAPFSGLPQGPWCAGEFRVDGSAGYAPGAGLALGPRSEIAAAMLAYYSEHGLDDGITVGEIMASVVAENSGCSLRMLSPEVLSPIDCAGRMHRAAGTIGVHHYAMSWAPWWRKLLQWISWHGGRPAIDALLKARRRFCGRVRR